MNATFDQPVFVDKASESSPPTYCDALLPAWFYRERWHATAAAALLSALVCLADIAVGREFQVVPLYLLPVGLATWVAGRASGMGVAGACAVLWLAGELLEKASYVHELSPYSNAAGLFVTFAAVSWIVARLHSAMHSLEDTVQRRTAALLSEMGRRQRAEEARLRAERMAVVGTMSAQLAHEVRNPLGCIKLNIDLLGQEITALAGTSTHPAGESLTLLAEFNREVMRIKQVVDGCTGLVRHQRLEARPLRVNEYLEKQLRFVRGELAAAGVRLVQDFDPCVSVIESDGTRLWEALLNLIRNARQAMPEGGMLTVTTKTADAEVLVSIADTGGGIPPEHMDRLYTPFFTTKPDGTGLGLVLVHQVVNELGGHISCRSEEGRGTVFTISLPRECPVAASCGGDCLAETR
ncbi:MAG: hypothetical protein K1X78_04235 [Verrucomicrobiaceae bacterium]|nr:hypothetical protein [Verrucomicrobiaceae bacterium]